MITRKFVFFLAPTFLGSHMHLYLKSFKIVNFTLFSAKSFQFNSVLFIVNNLSFVKCIFIREYKFTYLFFTFPVGTTSKLLHLFQFCWLIILHFFQIYFISCNSSFFFIFNLTYDGILKNVFHFIKIKFYINEDEIKTIFLRRRN